MEEEITSGSDNIVTEFNTYEDFLDSQISSLDLYYLEVSKSLLKLAPNSTLTRKLFEQPHILQKMFVIVLLMCETANRTNKRYFSWNFRPRHFIIAYDHYNNVNE